MKKISLYRISAVLVTATILFAACTKESSDVRLDPQLSTSQVLNVKSNSATIVAFVVAFGDGFSERGVCYNTSTAPTVADKKTVFTGNQGITATFTVSLSGLNYATKYYARAYAVNSQGTIYGDEVTFTTSPVVPTLTTTAITLITGTTATGGGNVTVEGGSSVTARGVCYGTNHNPTVSDSKTSDGVGTGAFTSSLTGLAGLTTYYVRAYATNTVGTGYGPEVSFTTLISVRTWNLPGDYVEASYPGSGLANWSPDKSPQVKSTEATPDNIEGYVYMANASNQWKFATKNNWDGPNYGAGTTPGTLDAAGDNISSPAGYYKINVNPAASPMTYTAVATVWGVIGNASPNGWNDETALTYNPASTVWTGAMHLTVGEIKFRANHSWDYNYGSTAKNATLNAGGDNIPVALEADYAITLDLSHPNAYTYSANRWGIIGSATADGWNSDQNMTWNPTTRVFTATINLVAGEIKFRANDDWAVNLGGTLTALTPGGDNIPIATAGSYTITLDPWAHVATLVKN
jgi:starch-binding outer membrane protein SusE/F